MAIWTACRKHAVLCSPQSAVNTCWREKVCSLQIGLTDVLMICVQFYSFTLDMARSAVVIGPRDKSSVRNRAFVSGATQRMSQDCRNSVFEQPILIAQYHDLAQKMTFKPPCNDILTLRHWLFLAYSQQSKATKSSYRCFSGPVQNRGQQLALYRWPYVARTGPKWHNFSGPPRPPPGQGRTGKRKSKNKEDSVVRKMAAGRKCHQHDKCLSSYFSRCRERPARQAMYV